MMKRAVREGVIGMLVGVVAILCVAGLGTLVACSPFGSAASAQKPESKAPLVTPPKGVIHEFDHDGYHYVIYRDSQGTLLMLDKTLTVEHDARQDRWEEKKD